MRSVPLEIAIVIPIDISFEIIGVVEGGDTVLNHHIDVQIDGDFNVVKYVGNTKSCEIHNVVEPVPLLFGGQCSGRDVVVLDTLRVIIDDGPEFDKNKIQIFLEQKLKFPQKQRHVL